MDGKDDTMEEQNTEDVTNGRDVTISLVPNSTTEKASACASPKTYITRKRGRSADMERPEAGKGLGPGPGPGPVLCEIHANSSRLCQCSKYFEALMSEKWTVQTERDQPSSAMKVYLEVQTGIRYYQDCFSRMIFLHQPIGGVKHCIELLKVASQIEYKELMDICLRCLSAIPWSSEEEVQIHEFCASGQYFSLKSADDLRRRMRLDLTETQKQMKVERCVARALKRYLRCALEPKDEEVSVDVVREESREVFVKAFEAVISGTLCGKTSESVLQCALTLVKDEADSLISSFEEFDYGEDNQGILSRLALKIKIAAFDNETKVLNLWWLFQTLRKANAAHVVIEALLTHEEFAVRLMKNSDISARCKELLLNELIPVDVMFRVRSTMRELIMVIFEDVLKGRLFLDSSDRMELFWYWKWLLHECHTPCPCPSPCSSFMDESATSRAANRAKVLASYIKSFPLKQQEEINHRWIKRPTEHDLYDFLREDFVENYRDLKHAHMMWVMNLVTQVPRLYKQKQAASHVDKEPIRAAGTSKTSECGTSDAVPTKEGSACAMVQVVDENVAA